MVNFAGEDLSVVVIELGSNWIKVGYAGEDLPKAVIPGWIGYIEAYEGDTMIQRTTAIKLSESSHKSYFIGDLNILYPRPNMNIKQIMKDDIIHDSDDLIALFTYIFNNCLKLDPSETPILLAEPVLMNKTSREKIVDILFDKFKVPALYISKTPVLAAFSQGKHTCLVVDIGGAHSTVTPVVDGYFLKNGHFKQFVAGNVLTDQCLSMFEKEMHIPIRSHYEIASKEFVNLKEPPKFISNPFQKDVQESFKDFAKWRVAEDFKECVCQVAEEKYDAAILAIRPPKFFEFPDGYNCSFLAERYRIPEILFHPQDHLDSASLTKQPGISLVGLPELIQKSLSMVDIDIRATLCSNIVIFGGSSLFSGLIERLTAELSLLMPAQKFRIFASNNSAERKFAPWIGGSILGSLPTFQQLWMAKSEYDEHGPSQVEKRCQL